MSATKHILSSGHFYGKVTTALDHPLFLASVSAHEPAVETDRHRHANPYFSLLLHGRYIEKNGAKDVIVQPGQLLYRPADYVHANTFLNDAACFNVELKPSALSHWAVPAVGSVLVQPAGFPLYKLLAAHLRGQPGGPPAEDLVHFFDALYPPACAFKAPWLPTVKTIVETELDTVHTLDELARRVYVHPVYLARAFKQHTGTTVGNYRLGLRLARATKQLFNPSVPVYRVAAAAGFHDSSHFIRAFRAHYGLSPRQFRARLKG